MATLHSALNWSSRLQCNHHCTKHMVTRRLIWAHFCLDKTYQLDCRLLKESQRVSKSLKEFGNHTDSPIFQSSSDTDHWNHEKKQIYLVRTDYRSTAYSRTSYWGITEEPLTEPLTKIKLRTTRNCCAQATSKCERLYEVSASRVIAGTSSGTWKWRFDWNNLICLLKLTLKSVSECSAMKSGFQWIEFSRLSQEA